MMNSSSVMGTSARRVMITGGREAEGGGTGVIVPVPPPAGRGGVVSLGTAGGPAGEVARLPAPRSGVAALGGAKGDTVEGCARRAVLRGLAELDPLGEKAGRAMRMAATRMTTAAAEMARTRVRWRCRFAADSGTCGAATARGAMACAASRRRATSGPPPRLSALAYQSAASGQSWRAAKMSPISAVGGDVVGVVLQQAAAAVRSEAEVALLE